MRTFSKVTLIGTQDTDLLPRCFHMRRCHICDSVNIHPILVNECLKCGKAMSPFHFYEEGALGIVAEALRPHYYPRIPTEYGPLMGITICWNES